MAQPSSSSWPGVLHTQEMKDKVARAKVLAVGAGGIGCELLKTLVLSGFRDVEVIDMDTIETSNLNRQFLFRKQHVGESKARVAAAAVGRLAPGARVAAHHGNVKEGARFGVDYFRGFDVILNGLDNLEARRHVNRMALAAGTPLVESGSAGYLGQVSLHVGGGGSGEGDGAEGGGSGGSGEAQAQQQRTECFECAPKPAPRSYPVCTIRNTPDKPIHCVVWAKDLLFPRLFGKREEGGGGSGGVQAAGAAQPEGAAAATEPATANGNGAASGAEGGGDDDDLAFYEEREGEGSAEYGARVFDRVFGSDVAKLLTMDEMWKTRARPTPFLLDAVLPGGVAAVAAAVGGNGNSAASTSAPASACAALGLRDQHAVWDAAQNAAVLLTATRLFLDTRRADLGAAVFDKDDALACEFVAAASNLRALSYGIPAQSLFAAKGMAGNIIHAIATTNAILSGLIVAEALKLLAGGGVAARHGRCTFLLQHASNRKLLVPSAPPPPNPECMVCGTARVGLAVDTRRMTLRALVERVLKARLAFACPSIDLGDAGARVYEEGEGLEDDEVAHWASLAGRALADLPAGGIVHGSILAVEDQEQQLSISVVVSHRDEFDEEEHPDGFIVSGAVPTAAADGGAANRANGASGSGAAAQDSDDDDDVVIMENDEDEDDVVEVVEPAAADPKGKRPAAAAAEGSAQPRGKRAKQ